MTKPILQIKNLKKYYPVHKGIFRRHLSEVKAVDDVSFSIHAGEIVGLVGESGSGKTTVGRTILRLIEPTSGEIWFENQNIASAPRKTLRILRPKLQMVFQDPLSSLNPRKTILDNIGEALLYHQVVKTKEEQVEYVAKILKRVGLTSQALMQYPHQFSGGQKQRISIGRAIALDPQLVICDEAVSALDLSVQAQILNLLYELKQTLGLSYLFISHDLAVVRHLCDTVLVMHRGKIVEGGPAQEVFENPQNEYTKTLLASIPKMK